LSAVIDFDMNKVLFVGFVTVNGVGTCIRSNDRTKKRLNYEVNQHLIIRN